MLKDYITARAQLVTFILFILQIFAIEKLIETKQKRYGLALIIISILVANLHVAVWPFTFVLYLPYIAEYIIAILEEKTAKKFPQKIAVSSSKESLTYKELNNRANIVAKKILSTNIETNIIAFSLKRSISLYVTILGILKSGHT